MVWAWMTMPKRWFRLATVAAVLVGAIVWTVIPERSLGGFRDGKTLGYRLKYWQAAVELWKGSPLIGIGFDGYRVRVYEAQAKINDRNPGWFAKYIDPKPRRVHNEYLQALVDGGILYALIFFAFIGWVLVNSFKAARGDPVIRGVWCAQISVLVCAFFFFTFRLVDTTSLFHIYLGILCATFTSSSLRPLSIAKA
jgi:O-antigen ligase